MIIPILNYNPIIDTSNVEKKIEFFKLTTRTISVTTYYKNGLIHRDNEQPAVISDDGHIGRYTNGKPHCTFGPAIVHSCGNELYFYEGQLHNDCGAAVKYNNGYREYWVWGERWHRDDYFARYFCE